MRAPQANVEASSRGDGGPVGCICRGANGRLTGDSPPGAEASSGSLDTRRSWGRGVEEASGITRVRTAGNLGPSVFYVPNASTAALAVTCHALYVYGSFIY